MEAGTELSLYTVYFLQMGLFLQRSITFHNAFKIINIKKGTYAMCMHGLGLESTMKEFHVDLS